jgi:hypothetical protein
MKKKSIACDRCGARIDHIPEKCPECGEEIYARMDPHVRMRIENILSFPEGLKTWQFFFTIFCGTVVIINLLVLFEPFLRCGSGFLYFFIWPCIFSAAAAVLSYTDKSALRKNFKWIFLSQVFMHLTYLPNIIWSPLLHPKMLSVREPYIEEIIIDWITKTIVLCAVGFIFLAVRTVIKRPVSYAWLCFFIVEIPLWIFLAIVFVFNI